MDAREIFKNLESELVNKLKKIKACAFDVDGVLTDGTVWWEGEEVGWNRTSHTSDGYGLKVLQRAGLKVGVITGGNSLSIEKRYKENLGLDFVHSGKEDKRYAFDELLSTGLKSDEILYMGDEFFDIPLLKAAGFSATVSEAVGEVKDVCDYVSTLSGGRGAVRQVIDLVRYAQNIVPEVPDFPM